MVGYLRFFLALSVLVSHLGVRVHGANPGVFAVAIFYMLAGQVVTRLWDEVLPPGPGRIFRFYRDRFLRIFPLYGYICLLTVCFLLCTSYGSPVFSPERLLLNGLIIPLNYYMWVDSAILRAPAWCLIPPAWSLGAELQAYLLMPLLLLSPALKYILGLLSFILYCCALLHYAHPEYFSYRLLPGVLFFFILGHCLHRLTSPFFPSERHACLLFLTLVWVTALGYGISTLGGYMRLSPYGQETLAALILGVPLLYILRHGIAWRAAGDQRLGSLSYGVFLSHFLWIWLFDFLGFRAHTNNLVGYLVFLCIMLGSTAMAWLGGYYVEAPLYRSHKIK